MIINDSNLNEIRKVTSAIFSDRLTALLSQGNWQEFTELMSISTSKVDMGWIGSTPEMREWVGPKAVKDVTAYKYEIEPDPFEATVGIHKHKLEDGSGTPGEVARTLGLDHIARQFAAKAALWFPKLATDALLAGDDAASLCYDGQPMFDASHPGFDENEVATTYSNTDTSGDVDEYYLIDTRAVKPALFAQREAPNIRPHTTGDLAFLNGLWLFGAEGRGKVKYGEPRGTFRSTKTMNVANLRAHIETMADYRDDYGSLLGISPTILLVGRSLRFTADDILNKPFLATGESNDGPRLGLRVVYNSFMP